MTARWHVAFAVVVGCGGCSEGMHIEGQVTKGGRPFDNSPPAKYKLMLVDEAGMKSDFDLGPDGTFSGPAEKTDPLTPGPHRVLLQLTNPMGVAGKPPRISAKDPLAVVPGQTAGYVIDLPAD